MLFCGLMEDRTFFCNAMLVCAFEDREGGNALGALDLG